MRKLALTKDALDFIKGLEGKQFKQVLSKVLTLLEDPTPADSAALKGFEKMFRVDMGEFRIVYEFDENSVSVLLVGKRNDDEVYKKLGRKKR